MIVSLLAVTALSFREDAESFQNVVGAPSPGTSVRSSDCGLIALWYLARLEGRPMGFSRLAAELPRSSPAGYSMAELRNGARRLGMALDGVQFRTIGRVPDRPAIVLMRRARHGHFVVIRPVGHSGKLVQVIDNARDPCVVDFTRLYTSREWTGFALIPQRTNWTATIVLGLASGAVVGAGAITLYAKRFGADTRRRSLATG
jgi:hypothetical protein